MDIGNKVPTPSLCLLALLWKAVAALIATALCGCSCLTSTGVQQERGALGWAGGSTALAVSLGLFGGFGT